jgi:putative FmdB family regulatory protein
MPLYDFECPAGHVTEKRAGLSDEAMPCPLCGESARRVPFYASQYINGETVAKGRSKATRLGNVVDKHGRYRVGLFQEASAEVAHTCDKAEKPIPPLWEEAKKRVRQITGETVAKGVGGNR